MGWEERPDPETRAPWPTGYREGGREEPDVTRPGWDWHPDATPAAWRRAAAWLWGEWIRPIGVATLVFLAAALVVGLAWYATR
jgi:hypothetical protein